MRVELKQAGDTQVLDIDVEEDVRRARLQADDLLRFPPWTGSHFRKLGEIPELAEAFDAPEARFAAFVRARRVPWGTGVLVLAVALAGFLQLAVFPLGIGALTPDFAARFERGVLLGAMGYEPLLLDGAWWTPWTSQLLHTGVLHLLANVPVLAYCGFRVERALGIGGLAAVAAAAVLGGTACVTLFGALPVVGASILAHGMWGAQIAIGFRAGDAVPRGWRGFYGWGNLVLFVPLFLASLGVEGVSHLGHVGGLLGGILVASFLPAESFAPRAGARAARWSNLRLAAVFAALPMLVGPALARVTAVLSTPAERVEVRATGASLELPWRMVANPTRVAQMPAWLVSRNHEEPVFCGLARLAEPVNPDDLLFLDAWTDALGADVEILAPPKPLRPGFTSRSFLLRDAQTGVATGRVVEHDLRRGVWLLRAGYLLVEPTSTAPDVGREALYQHVLDTLIVHEPPPLDAARRDAALFPWDPERIWTLGRELTRAGNYAEADTVWTGLSTRSDGWKLEAEKARTQMWSDMAAAGEDAAPTGDAGGAVNRRASAPPAAPRAPVGRAP